MILATWIGYALASAWWFGSSPREVAPYVYAPLAIVVGALIGLLVARRVHPRVAVAGTLALSGFLLVSVLLTDGPAKEPIGYANANAAVAVQLMALAGLMTLDRKTRHLAWLAVVLALLTTMANQSRAAFAVAIPLLVIIALARHIAGLRRRWVIGAASVLSVSTCGIVLVVLARTATWPSFLVDAFDDVRRSLWNQAWGAFRRAEQFGGGPGRFERVNTMGYDSDRSSAHSLPLQVAVELGGLGLLLLAVLFLVGVAIALRSVSSAAASIAVGAWTALAIHSAADHVIEYWPVTLAAGLVLGYGLVAEPSTEIEDESVELASTGARRP